MRKKLYEEIILLLSFIKWLFLATVVGVITGVFVTLFLKLLNISTTTAASYKWYFLFLPIVFFISSLIIKYLAPDAKGHGTEKIIEAIHKKSGKIKLQVVPIKMLTTVITIAGGGSAGKEGPSTQIGAGLASMVADLLHLSKEDRKKIVICGVSAGFATVIGTPIAGAVYAIEILILGRVLNEYLLPAFISAFIGFKTASLLGIKYEKFNITESINSLDLTLFMYSMLSGIFLGVVAIILIETFKFFEKLANRIKLYEPLKGILGGGILVILVFIFGKSYLGLGLNIVNNSIEGESVALYAFLIKILFTAITLNLGGSGGVITPIFFIGATAGSAFASIFGLNTQIFSAIGLAGLLASAGNAPITGIILAIELFGVEIAPYAAISCIVGFIISGHRSIFSSQLLGVTKSNSLEFKLNEECGAINEMKIKKYNKTLTSQNIHN